MTGPRRLAVLALAALTPVACTTTMLAPSAAAPVAAQLSVERFLQAANQRDVHAMGNLFGTKNGPMMDTGGSFGCAFKKIGSWFGGQSCLKRQEVEIRMDAIASILEHEDYVVRGEQRVPGRDAPTTRVLVDMTKQGEHLAGVPFVVVQAANGRWLVQEVALEMVMGRGR